MKHKLKGLMTKCIETTVTIKVSTLFRCSFTVSNFVLSFALKMQSVLKCLINVHNGKKFVPCCFDVVELFVEIFSINLNAHNMIELTHFYLTLKVENWYMHGYQILLEYECDAKLIDLIFKRIFQTIENMNFIETGKGLIVVQHTVLNYQFLSKNEC